MQIGQNYEKEIMKKDFIKIFKYNSITVGE